MALFTYQATDSVGEPIKGTMEAKDESALVDRLQEMGYFPITVGRSEAAEDSPGARAGAGDLLRRFALKGASGKKVLGFTDQLHGMLDAGLPLDRALAILRDLEADRSFRDVIDGLHKGIQGGDTLADSLAEHLKVFSDTYVAMVRAGEAGGALEAVLLRLKGYLEDTQRLKEEIFSALIYPLILTVVGGGAVAVMLFFVIPKFSVIFADMGGALPLPTQVLLAVSEGFLSYWWVYLSCVAAGAVFLWLRLRTKEGKMSLDRLKLRLPVFGPVINKIVVSRFSRTLGTLLYGGIPIIDALQIARETMGNRSLSSRFGPVVEGVRKGRGMTEPLRECGAFPALALHMLAVGEETGRIDEMLLKLADNYDREVSNTVKRLLSLMEPAVILVMAVVVGFIVISLLLAVFSLNDMPM